MISASPKLCEFRTKKKWDGKYVHKCPNCGTRRTTDAETLTRVCVDDNKPRPIPGYGAGTELHQLLGSIGIHAGRGCKCRAHAKLMNVRGVDWCASNIDMTVGVMREAAKNRGLPFVEMVARAMVRYAIRLARHQLRKSSGGA